MGTWIESGPGVGRHRVAGVKICGVTRAGDAEAVATAGADAIGVNLWPGSKRFIDRSEAAPWLEPLAGRLERVAVLVNPELAEVEAVVRSGVFDSVQLHGDEPPEFCARVAALSPKIRVIKALRVREPGDVDGLGRFGVSAVLLDAFRPGEFGGTGAVFDWSLGGQAVRSNPDLAVILAGGLTPGNVAEAVASVNPAAVDVAGGVESAPGVKDPDKVREFVANAKGVGY